MVEVIDYPKVAALKYVEEFFKPDTWVVVQEKIDGSNCAVRRVDGELVLQSRTTILDIEKERKGGIFKPFVEWALTHESLNRMPEGVILYGETMNNNGKIKYGTRHPFVLFDVYFPDTDVPFADIGFWAEELALPHVPIVWAGVYGDLPATLDSFIAHSRFDAPEMEGVVMKAYGLPTWYTRADGSRGERIAPIVAAKVVTERFKETKAEPKALDKIADPLDAIADMLVTEARFDKAVQRAREEGQDLSKPHVLVGKVAQDAAKEDQTLIKDQLWRAFWKTLNSKIAQRVIDMHTKLKPA